MTNDSIEIRFLLLWAVVGIGLSVVRLLRGDPANRPRRQRRWQKQSVKHRPDHTAIRLPGGWIVLAGVPMILVIAVPWAARGIWGPLVFFLPLLVGVVAAASRFGRFGADASADGLVVRNLGGTVHIEWSDVAAITFEQRPLRNSSIDLFTRPSRRRFVVPYRLVGIVHRRSGPPVEIRATEVVDLSRGLMQFDGARQRAPIAAAKVKALVEAWHRYGGLDAGSSLPPPPLLPPPAAAPMAPTPAVAGEDEAGANGEWWSPATLRPVAQEVVAQPRPPGPGGPAPWNHTEVPTTFFTSEQLRRQVGGAPTFVSGHRPLTKAWRIRQIIGTTVVVMVMAYLTYGCSPRQMLASSPAPGVTTQSSPSLP